MINNKDQVRDIKVPKKDPTENLKLMEQLVTARS
jgi:hypothetical protein